MVVFGCAVSHPETYESTALRSIERIAEADSAVLALSGYDSIRQPYNEILDRAAEREELEAVVLIHQDIELTDASLLRRVRPLLSVPEVGVIGILGGRGVPPHCWWQTDELFGRSCTPLQDEHHSTGSHEVEVVDGALLVLAPWVAKSIRFEPALDRDFHGYDVDFCLRVRAAGGRVICNDVPYFHHMEKPWADGDQCMRAGRALASIWGRDLHPRERLPSFPS